MHAVALVLARDATHVRDDTAGGGRVGSFAGVTRDLSLVSDVEGYAGNDGSDHQQRGHYHEGFAAAGEGHLAWQRALQLRGNGQSLHDWWSGTHGRSFRDLLTTPLSSLAFMRRFYGIPL